MSNTIELDDLLTSKEAARLLGIRPNTLEVWRHQGKGPPFLKLGDAPQAAVRYLRSAVTRWAAQRAFSSTSAHSASVRQASATTPVPRPWDGIKRVSSVPSGTSE